MSGFDEPTIDSHTHVFDLRRFPYAADTFYRPAGQEIGTPAQLLRVMDAHGVRHALLVEPNSGYGEDNRCMLDAIARSGGRFKGVAVVRNDVTRSELAQLKSASVVGVAYNAALLGVARAGRAAVKLSGYVKFSREPHPHPDAWPFVHALLDAFGADACMWASDWPFLRAPERVDYGPLLQLAAELVPDPVDRRKLMWDTPRRLFAFGAA